MPVSAPTVRLDAGQLAIDDVLSGCHAAVVTSDGVTYTTDGPSEALKPTLSWHVEPDARSGGVRLWLEVDNTTPHALTLERLDVLVAPSGFHDVPMGALKLAQTGWMSWSVATPPVPPSQHFRPAVPPVAAPMLPPSEADRFQSPFMTLLRTEEGQRLLAGFVTGADQQTVVSVQPAIAGHRLTASAYLEGFKLERGARVKSETLLLLFGEPDDRALEIYAREVATEMKARPYPRVTTGWCSWYYFYTEVSEADMLSNLEVLDAARDRMPVEVVQLDDGYQTEIGDWLSLNEKFPSGLRVLTDRIHEKGYQAGIWLAPFTVGENSEIYKQHPDWVLRDAQGEPINALYNWEQRTFGLDLTHPEVVAWLRKVFTTICEDWNFDYLKIDFIYAGALRAKRHDPTVTSVQAYRRGLALIREIAGDRFILGCGCPFVPSVGYIDGARVGPDTAPFWRDADPTGVPPALVNAIRSTLAHGWMHRRWYVNDPDCLIVRATDTKLTEAEVQTWASVVALSGGMVLLSDDLARLDPARAAIIPRALPPYGVAAVPRGDKAHLGIPECLQVTVPQRFMVAGLFNWYEMARSLTFFPDEWDMPGTGAYHLFDLWDGTHHGPLEGPYGLPDTEPHGVRLLAVYPDKGRPQLVGTTLHLMGGAVEVRKELWDGETLMIRLGCEGRHEGEVVVYVPEGYEYDGEMVGRLIRVPVVLTEEMRVTLQFTCSS